jgi:hypothetical protein
MVRALSSVCFVLLICFGGSAWGKPKLAILGLEVTPGPTGVVDPAMTQVAKDITKELRQRAQSAACPYVVAPNSSKELTDEKLLMSCDNEAKECMAVIGTGLATDALLYGRVEKKGDVYRVLLKLLDVKAKTLELAGDEMPVGGSVTGVSRRLYSKLIGDNPNGPGALIVNARSKSGAAVDGGKVIIDEDRKGVLAGGRLVVTGLAEGRHVVAIETSGLERFEASVAIRGGEQATLDAVLVDRDAPAPVSQSHALAWKVSLGTGLAVAAAGGALAFYSWEKMKDPEVLYAPADGDDAPTVDKPSQLVDVSDCGKTAAQIAHDKHSKVTNPAALDHACTWRKPNIAGFVVLGVGGAVAIGSLVMLIRDPGSSETAPTGARNKKPEVAIAPILLPDLAGATLSVTW